MEDAQIIDHFFRRDPEAIRAAQEKYEKRCLAAARHILPDDRDAEECVSDVWLRLWNAIPPERPPFAGGVYHHRHPPPGPGQVRL